MNNNDWLPIETAPKDETPVLVCYKNDYDGKIIQVVARRGKMWINENIYIAYGDKFEPTHWMPLPNPPVINTERI